MATLLTVIGELLAAAAGALYGLGWLAAAFVYSLRQREFWLGNRDYESHLRTASHELWSLSSEDGVLDHNFLVLPNGTQLHYLTPKQSPDNTDTLVVFLHGFPDSAHLFSRQLRSPFARKAKLTALDLPGCGGSDSLVSYSPDQVLNIVAEAIVQLKHRYLQLSSSKQRCILVGHDWGAVIGFRIVAETQGLIDRLVTLNSLWPAYAEEVLTRHVSLGSSLLSQWRFSEALKELGPVWSQLNKSGYTYMLTLPLPKAKIMPRVASCLLKYAHGMEYKGLEKGTHDVYARRLAMAYGPSVAECAPSKVEGPAYGPSVHARASTSLPGDWDGRVLLYKDGLLRGRWTLAISDEGVKTQPEASGFKCPVHIIFGLQDVALDSRVVVDGIEKYFQDSEAISDTTTAIQQRIIRLPECGHWSILEAEGANALDKILSGVL